MRATWMGAAVAAVLVCGAGVQRAEAAIVTIDAVTANVAYPLEYAELDVSFSTGGSHSGSGYYSEYGVDDNGPTGFSLYSQNVVGSLYSYSLNPDGSVKDASVEVTFIDPLLFVTGDDNYVTTTFDFGQDPFGYQINETTLGSGTAVSISFVPLPSADLLFALSLLAFGSAGYTRHRVKSRTV